MPMLVELRVKNFMSFKDETVFSMERSNVDKTTLPENIVTIEDLNILKSALIFGPNASGKTNLVQALHFLRWLVKYSRNFERKQHIKIFPFKLDTEYRDNKPISFSIKFIKNNNIFDYHIDIKKIKDQKSEYLFNIPFEQLKKNGKMVFTRKGKEFNFSSKEPVSDNIKNISNIILENTLLISTYGSNDIPELEEPYRWFTEDLIVDFKDHYNRKLLIEYYFTNEEFKNNIANLLNNSDLGEINKFEVKEKKIEMDLPKDIPEELKEEITLDNKYIFNTYHSDNKKEMIEFDFELEESKGTQKYLLIYSYIFDIIKNNRTLVVDEIENSLHPELLKLLFQMVHKKGNRAQLISTSHSYSLLQFVNNEDEEIFRRDQIWFTRKRKDRSTQLYSLINIGGIRKDLRIFKAYFDGRLEAYPNIELIENVQR